MLVNIQAVSNGVSNKYDFGIGVSGWFGADNDYKNHPYIIPFAVSEWTDLTGDLYSATLDAEPEDVYRDGVALPEDDTLTVDSWSYDLETTTLTIKDTVSDPISEDDGYISFKPVKSSDYTPLWLESQSDQINTTGSWLDESTGLFRDPVTTDGEMTILLNANTVNFYNRLDSNESKTVKGQLHIYNADGEFVVFLDMSIVAKNKFTSDSEDPLELGESNFYDKTTTDAKLALKIDKPTGVTGSEWLFTINSAGVLTQTNFKITSTDQLLIPIAGEAGYISLTGKRDPSTGLELDIEEYTG